MRALQSLQRTVGRTRNIPQDMSTILERKFEDGEKEEGRIPVENMTIDLCEPGFEEHTNAQSTTKGVNASGKTSKESDRNCCLLLHIPPTLILALRKMTVIASPHKMQH